MAIKTVPNTPENAVAAESIPQPRHIWYDVGVIHVYTGADIPQDPG